MVSNLEDYVTAVEKIHGRQAKEYEKVLKVSFTSAESLWVLSRRGSCFLES